MFHIYGALNIIEFTGIKIIDFRDIEVCGGYGKIKYVGEFKIKQWKNILTFLKAIPEQPITVRFTDLYSDGSINYKPHIYISSFTINF